MSVGPLNKEGRFSLLVGRSKIAGNTVAGEGHLGKVHTEQIVKAVKDAVFNDMDKKLLDNKHRPEVKEQILVFIRERVFEEGDKLNLPRLMKSRLEELALTVLDEVTGFGPIQVLLDDDHVSEVMVNGPETVYVERQGKIELTDIKFRDNDHVLQIIERIVSPIGRKCDESTPMVDARLPDGSRVNAIISPLALNGPTLTIRKFFKDPLTIEDLVNFNTLTKPLALLLEQCVKARLNIVVSGGTGSGKTTTLNILSSFIPDNERIITIEDAAELQLSQRHLITLESRPPNLEGKGAVTIRDLVRNALRMRPDRIVVGEVRSGEALDMLQAMNTGHDGSLTTGHANSPRDMFSRLETMVLMSGIDLPHRAIREQVSSAIDLVVQQNRLHDGRRRITDIVIVKGLKDMDYEYDQVTSYDPKADAVKAGTGIKLLKKILDDRGFPVPDDWRF